MLTKTKERRRILKDLKFYTEHLRGQEESAKFFFRQRGKFDGTDSWGFGPERKYDYCRQRFVQIRQNLKFWKRMIAKYAADLVKLEASK